MAKDNAGEKGRKQELEKARPLRAVSPFTEMERMFEGMFPPSWLRPMRWEWPSWVKWRRRSKAACPKWT